MSESIHSPRGRNILYTYRVHASSVRSNVSKIEFAISSLDRLT